MNKLTCIHIIITVFLIYSFILDYLVSYTVFKYDMIFFLSHEGNEEFAHALATHTLPLQTITANILVAVGYSIILILAQHLLKTRLKNKNLEFIIHATALTCYTLVSIAVIYVSITHILGALSWILLK